MTEPDFEQLIGDMADFAAETLSAEQEEKERARLTDTIRKVSEMLRGKSFSKKCKEQAKSYGVNERMIKNVYASSVLNAIGETTGVVLEIVGEAFNYLTRFISFVLQRVMDFTVSLLTKIVNVITFRKEVTE